MNPEDPKPPTPQNSSNDDQKNLNRWLEHDLTALAKAGDLKPAFRVDGAIAQLIDILEGGRSPILTGESGVGKTAIFYELLRRLEETGQPSVLQGKRILQFSIRQGAASFRRPDDVSAGFQDLIDIIIKADPPICPYFRDLHLAYQFDLEALVQSAAFRSQAPLLAEGERNQIDSIFDYLPELEQTFTRVPIREPDLAETRRLLDEWTQSIHQHRQVRFEPDAVDFALHLAHRFMSKGCMPRKVLDLLDQVTRRSEATQVSRKEIIQRFCANHRVPEPLVDPDTPLNVDDLEREFRRLILGQDEAVEAIVNMIGVIKAGLTDPRRPFGVFLFVGPTGVGKTHLARLLAQNLFGSDTSLVRFNMADYSGEHATATVFGDSQANTLRGMRGELTLRLTGHPFAVILLDEFEKAFPKVHDGFLQLFDEGRFINGAGETVLCRSTIIIATSNAGAEAYRRNLFGFAGRVEANDREKEVDKRLFEQFRFEFLNRFDQIVHFRPLKRRDIRTIALRELENIKSRVGLKASGIELDLDETVLDWLSVNGYDPNYGARFLRRTIERNLTSEIAGILTRERPAPGRRIVLTVRGNRIVARLAEEPEGPKPRESTRLPMGTQEKVRAMDEESLLREAHLLQSQARELIAQLEEKKEKRSELLTRMNDAGFWSNEGERGDVLDRFRELDVTIRAESRIAQPLYELREMDESGHDTPEAIRQLARMVEAAAEALREWQERLAEEGSGELWLVLSNEDPLRPTTSWLRDLVRMEQAWCRQLHLSCDVLGYSEIDGELSRVVLEVEGPGAHSYLSMEHGIHRLQQSGAPPLRIRIEVIPKGSLSNSSPKKNPPSVTPARVSSTLIGREPSYRGRLVLSNHGMDQDWLAHDGSSLTRFLHDFINHYQSESRQMDVARTYGEDGSGARDPRTQAVISRYRQAIRGRLDPLLQEWRKWGPHESRDG